MKIVVTGANGQLGQSFQKIAPQHTSVKFIFLSKNDLDITNENSVNQMATSLVPDYIINCAAYTGVDKAESDIELAESINVTAVEYLAKAAKNIGAHLVHYSSDYVYHNGLSTPLKEDDVTTPKGVYASTKLEGEHIIREVGCKHTIIRTSWVYSEFGNNFVKTMLRLAENRAELNIVNDQIGCPTYALDTAKATMQLLNGALPEKATLNYAGDGQLSWYDFAIEIFALAKIDMKLHPIPTSEYPTPATRPLWSVMDLNKVRDLGIVPKNWKTALKECMTSLR